MPWVDIEVFGTDTKELVTPAVVVDNENALDGSYRFEPITPLVLKGGTVLHGGRRH